MTYEICEGDIISFNGELYRVCTHNQVVRQVTLEPVLWAWREYDAIGEPKAFDAGMIEQLARIYDSYDLARPG